MTRPLFRVLAAGPLTMVQDAGRVGVQRYGVPRGGAMDWFAFEAANRLVGNLPTSAALEITLGGLTVEILAPILVAITGAEMPIQRDETPLPCWTAIALRPGDRLALGMRQRGARAYLAVAGGIAVPQILGGAGTYLGGGFGGFEGRVLRGDDVIHGFDSIPVFEQAGRWLSPEHRPAYASTPTLRFIPGPHTAAFVPEAITAFVSEPYVVAADSNRMGYRLGGPRLSHAGNVTIRSLGVVPGVVQVPPSGQPILLMADAQTTGGYPIIGTIISADLPLAAQLLPGDTITFAAITSAAARAALSDLRGLLLRPAADDTFGTPV